MKTVTDPGIQYIRVKDKISCFLMTYTVILRESPGILYLSALLLYANAKCCSLSLEAVADMFLSPL